MNIYEFVPGKNVDKPAVEVYVSAEFEGAKVRHFLGDAVKFAQKSTFTSAQINKICELLREQAKVGEDMDARLVAELVIRKLKAIASQRERSPLQASAPVAPPAA